MSVSHRYRNFGGPKKTPTEKPDESTAEALEDEKLQAFEAGYQAGWDDAVKAQTSEREKLSAELAQNLQDMSFTYHEALTKLTVSFEPALKEIIEKLLPETVRSALSAHILEQISGALKTKPGGSVEIVVHSQNAEAVRKILEDCLKEPFKLVTEESLGEGQAFVRIGEDESQIDLDTLIADVSKAMTAFFYETAQEAGNGKP